MLIGVQDNGVICGIENDYSFLEGNPNWNGWSRHLFNIVEKQIGIEFTKYLQIKKIYYLSKTIAKIIVNKSSTPYIYTKKSSKVLCKAIKYLSLIKHSRSKQLHTQTLDSF